MAMAGFFGGLYVRCFGSLPSRPSPNGLFRISPSLEQALRENEPVVALESAIITHGMPFPQNIELALKLENTMKQKGVIPATVGVIKGQLVVGLSEHEIEFLGTPSKTATAATGITNQPQHPSPQIVKVSRRDLPYVLSQKISGGTTVSGTIIGAVKAGIPIFATGGIGGVHHGAEQTFDISADLKELGCNCITVVSAGIKSILDIGKTLEYLETEGVCVVVMKRKPDLESKNTSSIDHEAPYIKFPSFFTAESKFGCPYMIQDEVQGAKLIHSSLQLGLKSGILIAVPIPKEFEASGAKIERAIELSLEKAKKVGVAGRDITPFLLREINQLTFGESLEANKHLVENNVQVASDIAIQLGKLRKMEMKRYNNSTNTSSSSSSEGYASRSNVFNNQTVLHTSILKNLRSQHEESKVQHNEGQARSTSATTTATTTTTHSNNVGSSIAGSCSSTSSIDDIRFNLTSRRKGPPVVIGGSSLDLVLALEEDKIVMDGRTHSIKINTAPGGVARNIAEALCRLGQSPFFISAVAGDVFGKQLIKSLEDLKMSTKGILIPSSTAAIGKTDSQVQVSLEHVLENEMKQEEEEENAIGKPLQKRKQFPSSSTSFIASSSTATAIYSMILSKNGECLFGLGDMRLHSQISSDHIESFQDVLETAAIVVLDTNITVEALTTVLRLCTEYSVPVWIEPTEIRKVKKLLQVSTHFWPCIRFISPNLNELVSLSGDHGENSRLLEVPVVDEISNERIDEYATKCFEKFPGLEIILLTKGKNGFLVFHGHRELNSSAITITKKHCPAPTFTPDELIKSVSGAGDCLNAGFIAGLLVNGTLKDCCANGVAAAKKSLLSTYNVPSNF